MKKPEPCPFCGKEIYLKQLEGMGFEMRWDWIVKHHVNEGCPFEIYIKTDGLKTDRYEAIEEAWNKRAK